MKGFADKLCKCFALSTVFIIFALCFSTQAFAYKPVYYDGWSDQFRVTVTYEVLNDHEDEGNGFGVYYYMPANGCYYKADTGQYSFVEFKHRAAEEKGTKTWTCDVQGPPCRIYMQVYGSAMDHTQYYIKKVEVEPLKPRPGTGLPTKFTLWEGKFGCSVATMFTNTIACDLFLDRGKPEFRNWYDPFTGKDAVFGDDKTTETYNYYGLGCQAPYIYGIDSDGNYYDQYGVAWPCYEPKITYKSSGKVVIDWRNFRNNVKKAFPKAKYVEVQYAMSPTFSNAKKKVIRINDLKKKTVIRVLKYWKNYYFRKRLSDGKRPLTGWSGMIKAKTK